MNRITNKNKKNLKGTALLIALLVMGVFITVSIALFGLIFREIRDTKNFIDAGKAYYAAESGIEEALYNLNTELPGWEGDENLNKGQFDNGVSYKYKVSNTCDSYPCFDPTEYDLLSILANKPEKLYEELDLSANTIIPMFVVKTDSDGKKTVKSIKSFVVQFFAGFNPSEDLNITSGDISGWDVLRWKIFGMKNDSGRYVTDSIDDFTAVSTAHSPTGEDFTARANAPSWFGSYDCSADSSVPITSDSSVNNMAVIGQGGIQCVPYSDVVSAGYGEGNMACSNTQARDYYVYQDGKVTSIQGCYEIGSFMDSHLPPSAEIGPGSTSATGLNYISLTNIMNPAMFKNDDLIGLGNYEEKRKKSRIFFRIQAFTDLENPDITTNQFVRDTAEIVSSGTSGDAKQSIEVRLKRGTYMPVFNFAIYSTYVSPNTTVPFYQDYQALPN